MTTALALVQSTMNRAAWVTRICEAWETTIKDIVQLGTLLLEAKEAIVWGGFTAMLQSDLPFSAYTAHKLMRIARDSRLADPGNARFLPRRIGVLESLTFLTDDVFENAVKAGVIHAEMNDKEVRELRDLAPKISGKKAPGRPGLLDTPTDLNKTIGACTKEELDALAKRARAAARFLLLLSAELAPGQICVENVIKKRARELRKMANVDNGFGNR